MDITCISDLHGSFPKLEGGDLLIIAGDLTFNDKFPGWIAFYDWFEKQDYRKKVYIAGNHDKFLLHCATSKEIADLPVNPDFADYLCDSGTEFSYDIEGFPEEDEKFLPCRKRTLKIWGSPWTKWFKGVNPHCDAFMLKSDAELNEKWALIPDDTDILITHSPPFGILDKHARNHRPLGCLFLKKRILEVKPLLHVFGHIHEGYGQWSEMPLCNTLHVNAAHMNEDYEPINPPIRINRVIL
jgi:Icc-related predicted phosphoesterase